MFKKIFFTFTLIAVLLSACATPPAPSATSAPSATEAATATAAPEATATTMSMPMDHTADAFNLSIAQYFLDSAGFHGIAAKLTSDKKIDPTTLSVVNRVKKVLTKTTWPAELNEQAQAFITSLGEFAAALEADKVEDATKLADTVHDAQHDLSHSIDDWMKTTKPASEVSLFKLSVAQFVLDSAGFHGIAEALTSDKKIDTTALSKVNRTKKVLTQTAWPTELNEQAQAFIKSLGEFAAALEADKVEDATKLADTVHDAQHDLSHSIDDWMKTAQPAAAESDAFSISVAQYILDSAGFHGIAETLASSKKIDTSSLSVVNRVKKVLSQIVWPAAVNDKAQAFLQALNSFITALEADNVDDAIKYSDAAHESQHDLSHAIDGTSADTGNH